jgi:sugar lactone lactonase YvrE
MLALQYAALSVLTSLLANGTTSYDAPVLRHLVNLDYSTNAISVFRVAGNRATLEHRFVPVAPKHGSVNGLAVHPDGLIYTAIDSATSKPCASCFEVFRLDGTVVAQVAAPKVPGAPGAPDITDISVDRRGDVFLSDYGQQAVYYYTPTSSGFTGPTIVVAATQNAASVAVEPDAHVAFVSGGCGFASVRPYTRQPSGGYTPGNCFGIGTIALIGGAVDDAGDVATPVDGAFGLVSISDAAGRGLSFAIPDRMGSVSGVVFSRDARMLYVTDHSKERVYAFARPPGGWLSGPKPVHVATYDGFKALDIVAVLP